MLVVTAAMTALSTVAAFCMPQSRGVPMMAFVSHWRDPVVVTRSMHVSSTLLFASTSSSSSSSTSSSVLDAEEWQQQRQQPSASTTAVPIEKSLRHKLQVPQDDKVADPARTTRAKIVGHRGALYDYLENTQPSFWRCVELGCDAVELDVFYLAKSHKLIAFHGGGGDANPGDLSDYCIDQIGANVLDLTWEETQQLRFDTKFPEFGCPASSIATARIPALEDVLLDLKGTGVQVKIELKDANTVQPVIELVERLNMVDQCCYSSFHLDWLQQLRQLRPNVSQYPTGALFGHPMPANFVQLALECGAAQVHLPYDACSVENIKAIRRAGLTSMAWYRGPIGMAEDSVHKYWDVGNEDETSYQAVLDSGVDELCVNRPDILLHLLRKQQ